MINILAWFLAIPLLIVLAYLALEIMMGLGRLSNGSDPRLSNPASVILVPAHNEALHIAATIKSMRLSAPTARLLVIADNCDDATAALARAAGADVVERSDPDRRGKGYALAFGRETLSSDPPDAVLVIDADCELSKSSAARLAALSVALERPVQATNLMVAGPDASPLVGISNFAMLIKNLVRARGLMRLGDGALLFGTGMAFPWTLFERLPLATADAVEDLQLGLWLAKKQIHVVLDDRSLVTSPAASLADSQGQRSRWEHGFLQIAREQALPLLISGVIHRSRLLAALGAHLLVPPLALLMLLSATAVLVLGGLGFLTGHWLPVAATGGAFSVAISMLFVAWWREGRKILPFGSLLRAPLYVLWKIPIYVGYFTRRQTGWNRTRREGEGD